MIITEATSEHEWDDFLTAQRFSPFLQSWTMGEVYREIGQEPIRLEMRDNDQLIGICLTIVVPARRGRHLAVQYGPVLQPTTYNLQPLFNTLITIAKDHHCTFLRISPFWPATENIPEVPGAKPSPHHLLAEHIWHLPLTTPSTWKENQKPTTNNQQPIEKTEEELMANMRKTTRNLIRRAEREGVTIRASENPESDLDHFFRLYDETRKRHHFVPYSDTFIRAQVKHFGPRKECTVYLAEYQGEVVASSVHMHFGNETSYHHGASTTKYSKIPASYLLQWTAIKDALKRGDHTYNFWGIAPMTEETKKQKLKTKNHPFAGVTTFKTGFGGELLELQHCMDIPVSLWYHGTKTFETLRKLKRGF